MEWVSTGIQVLVALGGVAGVASLFMVSAQKRKLLSDTGKTDAEAADVMAQTYERRAISLMDPYERIQERMEQELDEAFADIDALRDYVKELVALLADAGIEVPRMRRPSVEQVAKVAERRRGQKNAR